MARCQTCKDSEFRGMILIEVGFPAFRGDGYTDRWAPCPDCGGSGIEHCCDGLCEQPHPQDDPDWIGSREKPAKPR